MRPLLLVVIAGVCLRVVMPAFAVDQISPSTLERATLLAMDDDGDGVITQAEYREHHGDEELWPTLDLNNDRVLDANEFAFKDKPPLEQTSPVR